MRKWLAFVLAVAIFFVVHEGAHALTAAACGEYEAFHIRPVGLEVTFRTPVDQRAGIQWAFISGSANAATLLLGYVLLGLGPGGGRIRSVFVRASVYYLTLACLLLDAGNLSIGPFLYGGDANGIAAGLGVSRYLIQMVFLLVLLANRELVAQRLLPAYGVRTAHPALRPWLRVGYGS